MSVLIKMPMPKECEECPLYNDEFMCCNITHTEPWHEGDTDPVPIPENCPLIAIPPHGPLVDSNRLIEIGLHLMHTAKNSDISNGIKWLWQYIIEAPAIIEAEVEA